MPLSVDYKTNVDGPTNNTFLEVLHLFNLSPTVGQLSCATKRNTALYKEALQVVPKSLFAFLIMSLK